MNELTLGLSSELLSWNNVNHLIPRQPEAISVYVRTAMSARIVCEEKS